MLQYKPSKTVSRILLAGAILFVTGAFFNAILTHPWSSRQNYVCLYCHAKMNKVKDAQGKSRSNITENKCARSRRHAWIRLPESSELNMFGQPISVHGDSDRMWVYRLTNPALSEALVNHPDANAIRALLRQIEIEDGLSTSGESRPSAFQELMRKYPTLTASTRENSVGR